MPKLTFKDERNQEVYDKFKEVRAELIKKHGPQVASQITRTHLYQETADHFHLSWMSIQKIVLDKEREERPTV